MPHTLPRARSALVWLTVLLAACTPLYTPESPTPDAAEPKAIVRASAPELLAHGIEQRILGNYDEAATAFHTLLTSHPDAAEAAQARFYLAESFVLRGRWDSAVSALEELQREGDPALRAPGLFLLARAYEARGQHAEAAAAYGRYRELKTPIEPYAALRQAAQQQALGDLAAAADAFAHAAASDIARPQRAAAYEQAIAVLRQLGQSEQALTLYGDLLSFAEVPSYRARHLLAAADLAAAEGNGEQAQTWLREIVEHSPDAVEAPEAVTRLQAGPQPGISAASAARILFAHERYAEALTLFDTALTGDLAAETRLELRRLRALSQRALGDLEGAAAVFEAIIAEDSSTAVSRQARLDRIQTQGWSGDVSGAADQYRAFAAGYPDDPLAPEALRRAVELLERQGDSVGARELQFSLGQRYPGSAIGQQALERAARSLEQAGDLARAGEAWQTLAAAGNGPTQAMSYFWAAQVARRQGDAQADVLLDKAAEAAPDSYYGVRAAELRGRTFAGSQPPGAPTSAEAWQEAERWLASWASQPLSDTATIPGDPGVLRALGLAVVGLHGEAQAEWDSVTSRFADNPVQLYATARLANQYGEHHAALLAAERLAELAKEAQTPPVPPALLRLIYPTPYAAVVMAEAEANSLDPLLVYAMLRQESLFNPHATSWVGARGLAQVMPATGEGIAANLGVSPFNPDDLYRPELSIRFGAYYLGAQIKAMEGSAHGGLAAYNGGPGNAQRWAGGSQVGDPDAFAERIDYPETQGYVKAVYRFYGQYRRLYGQDRRP